MTSVLVAAAFLGMFLALRWAVNRLWDHRQDGLVEELGYSEQVGSPDYPKPIGPKQESLWDRHGLEWADAAKTKCICWGCGPKPWPNDTVSRIWMESLRLKLAKPKRVLTNTEVREDRFMGGPRTRTVTETWVEVLDDPSLNVAKVAAPGFEVGCNGDTWRSELSDEAHAMARGASPALVEKCRERDAQRSWTAEQVASFRLEASERVA